MSSLISDEIYEIIQNAKQYESIGRYAEAAKTLVKYWKNINEPPYIWGLSDEEKAEILLRCGSLAGYIGSCSLKKDSQELAQTLIYEAISLFSLIGDAERLAECETYMASTYQRIGLLNEARSWINSAFKYELDEESEVRLYTYIVEGIILFWEEKYIELVNKCKKLEPLFRESEFYILQGDFNNNYACGLMKLGDKAESIKRYNLAKYFYTQTKHYLFLARIENNLALFYKDEGNFAEAHRYALSARENFKKLGDKTREGFSIDTQAQIYMAEGKFEEALICAEEAVQMLENGENYCYLANSLQTKCHIELSLDKEAESLETLVASSIIASIHISRAQEKKFIGEYAKLLRKWKLR